jgi:uncharacterized protein (TIGR02996 family)
MNEESAFLRAIAEDPNDEGTRLVFADWLEERGDPRAEFIRLDCAVRRMTGREEDYGEVQDRWWELRAELDPAWRAVLGQSVIENCHVRFQFRCPARWQKLKATELPMVRLCDRCHKEVHYCDTIEKAKEHACAGHCVAVDLRVDRHPGDLAEGEFELEGLLMGDMGDFDEGELDLDGALVALPPRKKPWWKFW